MPGSGVRVPHNPLNFIATLAISSYLFAFILNPFGQTGFTAVTFLETLPLVQVIVLFFALGFGEGVTLLATTGTDGVAEL